MLDPSQTPQNLRDYQLGRIQGTEITKGRKEVTMKDYVDYTKTSGIGRIFSKIALFFENKGWVNEQSLEKLADQKISSLKPDDLKQINSIAKDILVQGQQEDGNQVYADAVKILVNKELTARDLQAKSALNSLTNLDLESLAEDKNLKGLYEEYLKLITSMGGVKIGDYRNHTTFEWARTYITHPSLPNNAYMQKHVRETFIEYLAEEITDKRLPADKMNALEEFIKENGKEDELAAIQKIRIELNDAESQQASSLNDNLDALSLKEMAENSKYKNSFSDFAAEFGEKLSQSDEDYFKKYNSLKNGMSDAMPLFGYFQEKNNKYVLILDTSYGEDASQLLKKLYLEYLNRSLA
jgi:hypothetical protein